MLDRVMLRCIVTTFGALNRELCARDVFLQAARVTRRQPVRQLIRSVYVTSCRTSNVLRENVATCRAVRRSNMVATDGTAVALGLVAILGHLRRCVTNRRRYFTGSTNQKVSTTRFSCDSIRQR